MSKIKIGLIISLVINSVVFVWEIEKYTTSKKENSENSIFTQSQMDYWKDKVSQFEILNSRKGHRTLLVGDSMIDRFCVDGFLSCMGVYNRGIGNETTQSLLNRIDQTVINTDTRVTIFYIGSNDLTNDIPIGNTIENFYKIVDKLIQSNIRIYILSLLPRGEQYGKRKKNINLAHLNQKIMLLNQELNRLCIKKNIYFVNISEYFSDKRGVLHSDFTNDGTHLNGRGYLVFEKELNKILKKEDIRYKNSEKIFN